MAVFLSQRHLAPEAACRKKTPHALGRVQIDCVPD